MLFVDILRGLLLEDKAQSHHLSLLQQLEDSYAISQHENCEVRVCWVLMGLEAGAAWAPQLAIEMLSDTGREDVVRPLFQALANFEAKSLSGFQISQKDGRVMAAEIFNALKNK